MPRAALLDIDGTLLDSNDAHAKAWQEVLSREGFEVPFERVRRMIGMGGDKVLPALTNGIEEDSERGKQIMSARREIFLREHLPKLEPTRGARALVEHMLERNLIVVIATSAGKDELDLLLERADVRDLIEKKTSADDAENSKPDPDIIRAAVERAKVEASEAIMIGDTPYDVEAAQRAGVRAIGFRSGGWSDDELAGAVAIYDDPFDLLAQWARSPFDRVRSSQPPSNK